MRNQAHTSPMSVSAPFKAEPLKSLDTRTGQDAFLFDRRHRSTELAIPSRALGRVLASLGMRGLLLRWVSPQRPRNQAA
jgi:hypothetical protein